MRRERRLIARVDERNRQDHNRRASGEQQPRERSYPITLHQFQVTRGDAT